MSTLAESPGIPEPRPNSDAPSAAGLDVESAVELYFSQIFRAARGAGLDAVEAEEITQETFMTLLERAATFEGRSQVRTFLFGILYNKLREHRRWRSKQRRHESLESGGGDGGTGAPTSRLDEISGRFDDEGYWVQPPEGPDAFVSARETRLALSDCMESAPPAQRMAFLLREVEGLGTDEICKILEISRTNLGVMLHRFRNRVRNCLESKGLGDGATPGPGDDGEAS
ncbi:MAG: sigma-70 family RNA polymerase sigma factor [Acidobacteriota bacterium]